MCLRTVSSRLAAASVTGALAITRPSRSAPVGARDRERAPTRSAHGLAEQHDLPDVRAGVRERAVERLVDLHRLGADRDRLVEVGIGESAERGEEEVPAFLPLRAQLRPAHAPLVELRLALSPGLLAVRRQEVREARLEV